MSDIKERILQAISAHNHQYKIACPSECPCFDYIEFEENCPPYPVCLFFEKELEEQYVNVNPMILKLGRCDQCKAEFNVREISN